MKSHNRFQELPKDEGSDIKNNKRCLCVFVLLLVLFLCISIFIWFLSIEDDLQGNSSISARLPHGGSHKRTCDDTQHGCCKIFTNCKVAGDHINYDHIDISVYRIVSHDNFMSNCPSLETLINKYNRHYGNTTTDCGEYGCCPGINLDCDNAIRKTLHDGNNQDTIDSFQNHKKYKPILIDKIDQRGTNCIHNTLYDIVRSYEYYYPEKDNILDQYLIILFFLTLILILTKCWQ